MHINNKLLTYKIARFPAFYGVNIDTSIVNLNEFSEFSAIPHDSHVLLIKYKKYKKDKKYVSV